VNLPAADIETTLENSLTSLPAQAQLDELCAARWTEPVLVPSGGSSDNPTVSNWRPDVITIGPDFGTGGVAFEIFANSAHTGFRTLLDTALRLVGAAIRLRRLMTP